MKQEPFLIRHAFWILMGACAFSTVVFASSDYLTLYLISAFLTLACFFFGVYYLTLPQLDFPLEDKYETAQNKQQARRNSFKVIKGGKYGL